MKDLFNVILAGVLLAVVIAIVIMCIHWLLGLMANVSIISLFAGIACLIVAVIMILNWREL